MELIENARGGYRFLTGIAAFSSGAVAAAGYRVVHATLRRPIPYRQGFALIDRELARQGRPRQALCGVALRSPRPFSFDGFAAFNDGYCALLADWDIPVGGHNPVARTNVAPLLRAPAEESLYSFAYTLEGAAPVATFVVAGAGDIRAGVREGSGIVRAGETGPDALADKAAHVMGAMAQRLHGLAVGWAGVTRVNVYTVHALHPYLQRVILEPMGEAAGNGVSWHLARPPITGLEFEMDVRGVAEDLVIEP